MCEREGQGGYLTLSYLPLHLLLPSLLLHLTFSYLTFSHLPFSPLPRAGSGRDHPHDLNLSPSLTFSHLLSPSLLPNLLPPSIPSQAPVETIRTISIARTAGQKLGLDMVDKKGAVIVTKVRYTLLLKPSITFHGLL